MDIPPITVVVSTRNRGDSIVKTVETILSSDYPQFELRVIDQSEDESTEASLLPFVKNPHPSVYADGTTTIFTKTMKGFGFVFR